MRSCSPARATRSRASSYWFCDSVTPTQRAPNLLRRADHQRAPAAADVEQGLARLHADLGEDVVDLLWSGRWPGLRRRSRSRRRNTPWPDRGTAGRTRWRRRSGSGSPRRPFRACAARPGAGRRGHAAGARPACRWFRPGHCRSGSCRPRALRSRARLRHRLRPGCRATATAGSAGRPGWARGSSRAAVRWTGRPARRSTIRRAGAGCTCCGCLRSRRKLHLVEHAYSSGWVGSATRRGCDLTVANVAASSCHLPAACTRCGRGSVNAAPARTRSVPAPGENRPSCRGRGGASPYCRATSS